MSRPDLSSIFPLEGGCACGNIRYSLNASPLVVHCCHCTCCQRETGTAFALNAVVEGDQAGSSGVETSDKFEKDIPSPVLLPVPSDSGVLQHIARCPVCFVPVWSNYGAGPLIKFVRVGTLDRPALLRGPDAHIFMRSKQTFFEVADYGKPCFKGFYPTKEGVWSPEALARQDKLLVRILEWRKENGLDG
ncbi:glutathione-dependent formaldehyde-activating enzyme [Colletotrichum higginsianum]|nr:glutathione-dependent formaldehyde-activating enzyme [Colletotrichum higginsianum]